MYGRVVCLQLEVARLRHRPVHPLQNSHSDHWEPGDTQEQHPVHNSSCRHPHGFCRFKCKRKCPSSDKGLCPPPPYSPDALVQSSQFGHQLSGPFVFIAAQVVYSLDGLGGRLQLVFIDVDSLILGVKMANMGRNETIPPHTI